jgi:hypothetical protein
MSFSGHNSESRRVSIVVPQQPAQPLATSDRTPLGIPSRWRRMTTRGRRNISQSLVRPILVVISSERLNNVVQVGQSETDKVIQTFPLELADPRLGKRIGDRCLDR